MVFKKTNGSSETELDVDRELPVEGSEEGSAATDKSAADLQAELEKAQTERAAFLDRAARLQAEFDNFRKRNAKEQQEPAPPAEPKPTPPPAAASANSTRKPNWAD